MEDDLRLRPFFSYYGCKWRMARFYPAPVYHTIVEPFAGAAGYALHYADHNVVLYDLNPIIVAIWQYLIAVTSSEIIRLPDVAPDGIVDDLPICQEAKWLIGFWLSRAVTHPRKTPSAWNKTGRWTNCFWGERVRRTIASQVDHIRHWKVECRDYADALDLAATWFIDPPYQGSGRYYAYHAIDYSVLGRWASTRRGQVIVCEKAGAAWAPFRLLTSVRTIKGDLCHEAVWVKQSPFFHGDKE